MPKGNAVIYKPKEVSWEREVTLKKKKAFLKTRAKGRFFPPCETQCKQTKLALLLEQFWPNFLPAPAGTDATSLFHIISPEASSSVRSSTTKAHKSTPSLIYKRSHGTSYCPKKNPNFISTPSLPHPEYHFLSRFDSYLLLVSM